MRLVWLVLLTLIARPLAAQTFMRAYSNRPFSQFGFLLPEDAIQLSDGSLVFTAFEGFVVHTDAGGLPVRTLDLEDGLGGPLSSINLYLLAQAGPEQVFVVGNTSADTVFALKLDLGGGIVWQKSYRRPSNQPRQVLPTPDGGLLMLASTGRGLSQSAIPILTQLDADGDLVWQRRYFNADPAVGQMNWYGLSRATNGDYLVTGTSTVASPARILVARLAPAGNVLWAREFAPSNTGSEHGVAIAELANGQLSVVVNNPVPGSQFGTVRLSGSGDLLSASAYSGAGANVSQAAIQPDGSVTAALTNLPTVVRLAPDGTPAFARAYDLQNSSALVINKLFPATDGGLISFGGYTFSFFGDFACTLFKTAADGLLPPGYHTPVVLSPVAYAPTLSSVSLGDSAGGPLLASQIGVTETTMVFDTLFATPPLALRDPLSAGIALFPNPVTDRLTLTWEAPLAGAWEILDPAGRVWYRGQLLRGQRDLTIDLPALPAGPYLWRLSDPRGPVARLFVKVLR